jgi:DNA-binding NarL/FixJ family response regulator
MRTLPVNHALAASLTRRPQQLALSVVTSPRALPGRRSTPWKTCHYILPLTQRESEVLRQLAYGLTNKEIAQTLHISYETVKEHVQHILRKIGVSDRTQAAVWAVRKELV